MANEKHGSWNGKERRSGNDRRTADRRNLERNKETGALTTRAGERRQKDRRKSTPKKDQA